MIGPIYVINLESGYPWDVSLSGIIEEDDRNICHMFGTRLLELHSGLSVYLTGQHEHYNFPSIQNTVQMEQSGIIMVT